MRRFQFRTSWKCYNWIFKASRLKNPVNVLQRATCYKNPEKPIWFSLTNQDASRDVTLLKLSFQTFIKWQSLWWECIFKSKAQELYTTGIIKVSIHKIFATNVFANLHEENVNINQLEKFLNVLKKSTWYSCSYKKALHKGKSRPIYE